MRIILLILLPPLFLFICVLATLWLPLPRPFPPPLSQGRNLVAAIAFGVLSIGYVVGLAWYVVSSFLQAGRSLDPILTPMGFTSQGHGLFGRAYHGSIEEREVEIDFLPAQGIRPAVLDVYVSADLGTRMAVGLQRPLLDCGDCAPMDLEEIELSDLQVYARREDCARSLLADLTARTAISRLAGNKGQELYLQPGRVWLRAHPRELAEAQIEEWLEDATALANTAERLQSSNCTP